MSKPLFIFDTDHLGILQRENSAEFNVLMHRVSQHPVSNFFVTIVSFHEQVNGWTAFVTGRRDAASIVKGYERLEGILADFSRAQVLPFSIAAAEIYDDLRKQRIRVGTMDLRIAAIAIANQMTVLTRNSVDFDRVPSLSSEDWTVHGPNE